MENIFVCYQCRECESQCPLAFWFDVPPPRVLQHLQRGEIDVALKSRTPWLCASCETCATQCPHRLDLAKVLTNLTTAARADGVRPRVSDAPPVSPLGVDVRQRATVLRLIPSRDKRAARVLFEARWVWFRLRKGTRALRELLKLAAFVVLAPPMALGLVAGVLLSSLRRRPGYSQ